jgi:adenylate kinase family enzyme
MPPSARRSRAFAAKKAAPVPEGGDAQTVTVFTGLPGTGKSTLAEAVAKTLRVPAFAGDWLMGALKPSGVLLGLERSAYLEMNRRLLWTLVSRQLMLDQSAILDTIVDETSVGRWREQARPFRARVLIVQCVCSDEDLHRSRVEGRQRGIPGWHEIDWDHVERMRVEFPRLSSPDLVVDAVNPLEGNVKAVLRLIDGEVTRRPPR